VPLFIIAFFVTLKRQPIPIPSLWNKKNFLLYLFRIIKGTITSESALHSLSTQASPELCRLRTPVQLTLLLISTPHLYSRTEFSKGRKRMFLWVLDASMRLMVHGPQVPKFGSCTIKGGRAVLAPIKSYPIRTDKISVLAMLPILPIFYWFLIALLVPGLR